MDGNQNFRSLSKEGAEYIERKAFILREITNEEGNLTGFEKDQNDDINPKKFI